FTYGDDGLDPIHMAEGARPVQFLHMLNQARVAVDDERTDLDDGFDEMIQELEARRFFQPAAADVSLAATPTLVPQLDATQDAEEMDLVDLDATGSEYIDEQGTVATSSSSGPRTSSRRS